MKYKTLYKELAEKLTDLGCSVCDHDLWGYCYQTKPIRGFIVIKSHMSYKGKYLTLCHEAGHLFYLKDDTFVWSKEPRSEEEANRFALELLDSNDIKSGEYRKFYEKAKKKVKKRRKSWFEI